MKNFFKLATFQKLTKAELDFQLYIEDKKKTTSDAIYANGWYRGFKVQKAKDTPSNRKRGDHHKRCLDKLIDSVKWLCSRHSRSLVFRYSLYPSHQFYDFNASKFHKDLVERLSKVTIDNFRDMVSFFTDKQTLQFVQEFTDKTENDRISRTRKIFTTAEYIWVRELGHSGYNDGEHYHGAFFCNLLQGRSANQYHKAFRIIAYDCIRLQLQANVRKNKEEQRRHIVNTLALEELTPFKSVEDNPHTPYVDVEGYFELHRNGLSLKKAKEQQAIIESRLKKGWQYPRLRIDKIADRKHYKNKAIGGDLEECIYAISYLSKVASKTLDDFPAGTRRFNSSKFTKLSEGDTNYERIAKHTKEVDQIFEVYNSREKPS